MSTKETARSAGTLVREVNGRLNIPKKVNLWTLTQYFGEKKRLNAPWSLLSYVVILRQRWLPRWATGSKYPYKVPHLPPTHPETQHSVKDKKSLGCKPILLDLHELSCGKKKQYLNNKILIKKRWRRFLLHHHSQFWDRWQFLYDL